MIKNTLQVPETSGVKSRFFAGRKILLSLFILVSLSSFAQLPHVMTPEEKAMMPDYISSFSSRSLSQYGNTNPPASPVRASAEWEEIDYLMVAWTNYATTIREIVRAARLETQVIIICGSSCSGSTDSTSIKNTLTSNSIPLTNIRFLYAPCNSVWSRDYGQWNMYTNDVDSLLLFDWIYNRPLRPKDDTLPSVIAQYTSLPLYLATNSPNDLIHTGGNFMVDGFGTAFSSNLVLNENPGKTEAQINSIMQNYFGITRYIKFPTLPYDQIHHIDMHLKLLDEQTLLVGQYPTGVADGPQIEANLQYILSSFNSVFGTPYKVVRIPMPPDASSSYPPGGDYWTYTNSVFVNKTIILPTYSQQYDTTAIRIYREALPGYTITGINCTGIITALGAIHCITKEVTASNPLLISHQPLNDRYDTVNPYQVDARIQHRSGISAAEIYFRTDTTLPYISVPMTLTSVPNHTWTGYIPAQPAGTRVYYYIHAGAVSGKQQVRPMPAPAGYWAFNVLNPTSVNENISELITMQEIFPNPSHGITCIPVSSVASVKAEISLLDITGRKVQNLFSGTLKRGDNKFFLNSSGIAPGVYLVTLTSGTQRKTSKLIIR